MAGELRVRVFAPGAREESWEFPVGEGGVGFDLEAGSYRVDVDQDDAGVIEVRVRKDTRPAEGA